MENLSVLINPTRLTQTIDRDFYKQKHLMYSVAQQCLHLFFEVT